MTLNAYLDNNATTVPYKQVLSKFMKYSLSPINMSSDNFLSRNANKKLEEFKSYLFSICNATDYEVIFTGSACEANTLLINGLCYKCQSKPHIITSSIEHINIIKTCKYLHSLGKASVSFVGPNEFGEIPVPRILEQINTNTKLVSIMSANNEIGSINNISIIGNELKKVGNIIFHSDAVQYFGRHSMDLNSLKLDAITISFHKFHGLKGIAALVIKKELIGQLDPMIHGSQQFGLRGGTENIAGILSCYDAVKITHNRRVIKNKKQVILLEYLISTLREKGLPVNFLGDDNKVIERDYVLVIGKPPGGRNKLCNTLLMSYITERYSFCNGTLKKWLDSKGIIVSIGSACNTKSSSASHVVEAMRLSAVIRRGLLRLSLSDFTTKKEIDLFIKWYLEGISRQG